MISKMIIKNIQKYKHIIFVLITIILIIIFIRIFLQTQNSVERFSIERFSIEGFNNINDGGKKIVPDLIEGLGNQLFIYAAAYTLSKIYNLPIILDNRKEINSFGGARRTYNDVIFYNVKKDDNLDKLNISDSANNSDQNENILVINENMFKEILDEYKKTKLNGISNTIPNNKTILYLTGGYYQEYSYFNEYRNEILNQLQPHQSTIEKVNTIFAEKGVQSSDNLVSIHIRLLDKHTPDTPEKRVYDDSDYDYIISDLDKFPLDRKFIVLSNNITECQNKFNSRNILIDKSRIIYISSEDYIELAIFGRCKEHIASPSTFCWWGIYLNPVANEDKQVYIYWKQDTDYRIDFYKKYGVYPKLINKRNPITFVSGYWNVSNKYNNKHNNKYDEWFKNTLAINAPYIFFSTNETKKWIIEKQFRKSYPTEYIEKEITDFKTYQLNMNNETNSTHVPSKELGLVWLEKINLVLESSKLNPYNTEWFSWIDAGICVYRDTSPPLEECPNYKKMGLLAKNKFNYCSSDKEEIDISIKQWDNTHNIAGTVFVLHISFIPIIHDLFYEYLNKCITHTRKFTCYSDQIILSHIYYDNPKLFNKVGTGYGNLIKELY